MVLEWFQRVWNRVVSEGFQRVWNRVVSGGFQRGLKPWKFHWMILDEDFWKFIATSLQWSLERRRNKFSKVFVQNHPMKNHTKFLLGNRPYEALKKTFWKNCYFSFKKIIGRSPKEFKEVFGQHPNKKIYLFFKGKSITKRNIEETIWQNRLIRKKNPHWRDVAINFQKSSSKIIQWKIIPILYWENAQRKRKNIW